MSESQLYRIKVRALMVLQAGLLTVEILPLPAPPDGYKRIGPHCPREIPLALLPPELQVIGSIFWMICDPRAGVVGYEFLDDQNQLS